MRNIWALADLHLAHAVDKPMDEFGEVWVDHPTKIKENWEETVGADDIVLLPGDLSWARTLDEAKPDLEFVDALPGVLKVLCKGNHDSWWDRPGRTREALPPSLRILHNEATIFPELPEVVLGGVRGWIAPADPYFKEEHQKVWRRELLRVERVLKQARELADADQPIILLLHHPPVAGTGEETKLTALLDEYQPEVCVFGHIHTRQEWDNTRQGLVNGTNYILVSGDYRRFVPARVTWGE